jgi:uncharacterized cupin superfamily protein
MSKVIIEKLSKKELENKGVFSWPIWTKEVSRFDWTYAGEEQCYIVEGEFDVETDEGTFHAQPGDFVTFKDGLSCIWDIKKPVKKHYNFH